MEPCSRALTAFIAWVGSHSKSNGACLRPAEGDQVPLPVIDDWHSRLSTDKRDEVARSRWRLEHSNLCELWQTLSLVREVRRIAERDNVLAPVHAKAIVDHDPAVLGLRYVKRCDERIRLHAARPDDRAAAQLGAGLRVYDAGCDLGNECAEKNAHALLLEPLHRDPR